MNMSSPSKASKEQSQPPAINLPSSSSLSSIETTTHVPGNTTLRRIYSRIRLAAFISNDRRTGQAGREAEPDSSALLGDIHMKPVVRVSTPNSGLLLTVPSPDSPMMLNSGESTRPVYGRQFSARSTRSNNLNRSSSRVSNMNETGGYASSPYNVPTGGGGGGGGSGPQASCNVTNVPGVNNKSIHSIGQVHFWRNCAFEQEGRPFMRVSHDVNIDDVASIMHGSWKLKPPRIVTLIISNVSSLKEWSSLKQRLAFRKGLIKAAKTTNMWIFTNATNLGASKVIGDAVYTEKKETVSFHCHSSHVERDYYYNPIPVNEPDITLIGIAREDSIKNVDNFTSGSVNIENYGNCPEESKYDLNPDHSHYIIVRDNTVNRTGCNLFTSRIMQYLSTIGGVDADAGFTGDVPDLCSLVNMEIPVVSIVIQGGYECARLVLDCLKKQFPVVVLRGSGGLADLLAYSFSELKQRARETGPWGSWDPEFVESYLKPELSSKIAHHFPKMRENTTSRNLFRDRIIECVRLAKQNGLTFLTILNMHNYSECNLENLSVYLLRALFKSKPRVGLSTAGQGHLDTSRNTSDLEGAPITDERLLKELYLTLDWNCPDVARDEVLIRDPSYCQRLQKDLFYTALLRPDREEFIDLFLLHGFRVHTFVTPKRLLRLFKQIYNEEFFHTVCWEGVLGHSLMSKPSKYFIDTDLNWLIETCTGLDNYVNSDHLYYNVMSMYVHNQASAERKALVILCLWAVFANRSKLVKTLWKHSDQPIHLALIISMAFERLSWHVGDSSLKNDLKVQSKLFADMAIGVLDLCYSEATCRAFDVLSEEGPDWNFKTAVDIAANARTRSFLAHPCCQKWLTNTFLGEIRIRELSWGFLTIPAFLKVLLSAFFIFPMFIWVRFKPKIRSKDSSKNRDDEGDADDEMDHFQNDETALIDLDNASNSIENGGTVGSLENNVKSSPSKTTRFNNNGPKDGGGDKNHPKGVKGNNINQSHRYSLRPDLYTSLLRDREVILRSQPPLHKMIYYMWTAPITKFWTFHTFYILYLAVFSMAVIWPSCGKPELDTGVVIWTALIVIENIHRTWILYKKYSSVPLFFKILETLLILGFVFIYAASSFGNVAFFKPYTRKVILCFALIYFYYRLVAIYLPISPTLGPLLHRLKLMVTIDFMMFMRMALVLIISSGIAMQAVMYPDDELNWQTFEKGFSRAWFTLFTTPTKDLTASPECEKYVASSEDTCFAGRYQNNESLSCPTTGFWPYFFTIQYFVLLKLIMTTLLYALFAATAAKLETDSIWKYQRYILVVDFASRLPLPSPLSIFCYAYYLVKWLIRTTSCYYCIRWFENRKRGDAVDTFDGARSGESKYKMKLSEDDFNFWRHLARTYSKKQSDIENESDLQKKQWEQVQTIYEEIEYEKRILRQLKGRIIEIERMNLTTHVLLENIKHLSSLNRLEVDTGHSISSSRIISPTVTWKHGHHVLSRQSPYPGTRVSRIPVPDKFVPWEVTWFDYDPVAYSKQKYDFVRSLQSFVDEDILLLHQLQLEQVHQKLPVFKWNSSSLNPAGITIDRSSHCIGPDGLQLIYKLDQGFLPRNPFGRTGLRGRGSLPRWGPNHYVMLLITRWTNGRLLEFLAIKNLPRRDSYEIPSSFVSGESLYLDLQNYFKVPSDSPNWMTADVMLDFFKSCDTSDNSNETALGFKLESRIEGYLDDTLNTDNAWKEIELFHIHYHSSENLSEKLNTLSWRVISEDVFVKLSSGQSMILHQMISKLQPTII